MGKLPQLLSIRQAAALTGLSRQQIWYALNRGHISSKHCQKVDNQWVLTEDFEILPAGIASDPMLSSLPAEFFGSTVEKDWEAELPKRSDNYNTNLTAYKRMVKLPGFERETEGMNSSEIYRSTRVHYTTQNRIREGRQVRAKVALRLAKGLSIPVERLLQA